MQQPWLEHDPQGVPAQVRTDLYASLPALLDECFRRYRDRPAFRFMGRSLSFDAVDARSRAFAAWLQSRGLVRGDRLAIMLPNLPQYPVAVAGALRAGLVVVNVNPQYTGRELEQQLKDAGAKLIVILDEHAAALQQARPALAPLQVVLTSIGDMLGFVKGAIVNQRRRRKRGAALPRHRLDGAVRFNDALAQGRRMTWTAPPLGPDDLAVLQYTGGTTGAARGAVLLHRNVVANLLQNEMWCRPALRRLAPDEQWQAVCALPLHQSFGFGVGMLLGLHMGACSLLIADADDTGAMLEQLARHRVHSLPAVGTVYQNLLRHPDFHRVDWSELRLSVGGGMAVRPATARQWLEHTGCPISACYGLSEAGPSVSCSPFGGVDNSGNVGLPLPGTELMLLDDDGSEVPTGSAGEIAIRGPQVMAGYWQRPDETARVMAPGGFMRSGDVGVIDERGHLRIVDRKKDMIQVGGFKVYPNEIEDVITQMPGVSEAAAIGIDDGDDGEIVKLVVVREDLEIGEADVRAFCAANLAGYKRPRIVEFRAELPKTAVGKILRRALRDAV